MEDFFDWSESRNTPKIHPREWMKTVKCIRVTSDTVEDMVQHILKTGKTSLDFETTGVNTNTFTTKFFEGRTQSQIVGACFSPDGKTGYYIPLRHKKGTSLNVSIVLFTEIMLRLLEAEVVFYFHNGFYDQEMAQYSGGPMLGMWDNPKLWDDSMILSYLHDTKAFTNDHFGRLKTLSKIHLGIDQIELLELYPKGYEGPIDFSDLDPAWEPVILYGAMDAICTFRLVELLKPLVLTPNGRISQGQAIVYAIEKMCAPTTRWMERMGVPVDRDKVKELIVIGQKEYFDSIQEIYTFCSSIVGRDIEPEWFKILKKKMDLCDVENTIFDQIDHAKQLAKRTSFQLKGKVTRNIQGQELEFPKVYDLMSRQQIGPLFEEMEIPGLRRTDKSGQVQTTQDEIERLDSLYGKQYPFLPKISRMGELQKALSTYLFSLYRHVGPDGRLHCNMNQLGTDTGRYTTPKGKPENGGATYPLHGTPQYGDKNRPECLSRIRETFKARPGKVIVAIDYASVELRIVTNLSKEPLWVNEYFRCSECSQEFPRDQEAPPFCTKCGSDKVGDLHSLTAIAFYGREKMASPKEWKILRGKAKSANFALAYGGGPAALVRATGCDEGEAAHHHRVFNQTYSILKAWWDQVINFGIRHGYVTSALGRHYPLPDLGLPITVQAEPNEEKRKLNKIFYSKARRNAVNAPVQMSSADFTKLAQGLIYLKCKELGWLDKVTFIISIHDELVFEVDLDILGEVTKIFPEIMARNKTVQQLKWTIPLTTDCEIGWDWTVPWNISDWENGRVREDGIVLDHKGIPTSKVWPMEIVRALSGHYPIIKIENPPEVVEFKINSLSQTAISLLASAIQANLVEKEGSVARIFSPEGELLIETNQKINHLGLQHDLKVSNLIEGIN